MKDPLEHNLSRLLKRAYAPVRPRPEFSESLLARVLDSSPSDSAVPSQSPTDFDPGEVPHLRPHPSHTERGRTPLFTPFLQGLAAAALVLFAVGSWLRLASDPARSAADWNRLGRTAIRLDEGPWLAAPDGELPWLSGRIEAVVPEDGELEIVALSGDRLVFGPGAHARLSTGPEGPQLRALAGDLRLDKAPHSPDWRVLRGEGQGRGLQWTEGVLTLAAGGDALDFEQPVQGGESLVPVDSTPVGSGDRVALAPTPTGDRPEVPASGSAGATSGSDGAGATGELGGVALTGRIRGVSGAGIDGLPTDSEAFRVWVRPLVDLPEVSEPTCYRITRTPSPDGETGSGRWTPAPDGPDRIGGIAGEFSIAGLEAGAYAVHVEVPGFASWRRDPVRLGPDSEVLDVELEAGATLRGYVLDARTQTPVVGALVLATEDLPHQLVAMHGFRPDPMPHSHAFTDGNGAFELSHVSSGPTHLRASHPDFAIGWHRLARVASGAELDVGAMELGQGGSVEGRVERRSGGALPNAMIVASRIDGTESISKQHFGAAATGPDGSYRIDHLAEGAYVVINVADDLGQESEWGLLQQILVRSGRTERVDFLAEAGSRRVAGRVVDADGRPLSGWVLTLTDADGSEGFVDWVASGLGPGGRFEFTGVRSGRHGLYLGRHANRSFLRCEVLEVPGDGRREVLVQLPNTELSGRLLDERTNEPVSGYVLVERFDAEQGDWDFAARDMESDGGAFRFPYLTPGRYRVTGSNAAGLATRRSEPFELRADAPSTVDLALPPAGRILVECADGLGRPIRGARLVLTDRGEPGLLNSGFGEELPLSDFNGRIDRGHLPLATVTARLVAPGFEPEQASLTPTVDGTLWRVVLRAREPAPEPLGSPDAGGR